ncbi:hypothetical protein NW766_010408 [Fusarium irregulare]|uniref:GST N-terminal domain-containing protein n=1 Tax=Fusarium irregulare TaxID=2494466 RepID=A0A9W8U6D5_9HYPO|nr:hypothetical protein NW766_010408 [Fusarium irregulare]
MSVHANSDDSWHGVVSSDSQFQPEKGRYHFYIGLFCPFAHRANLVRHIKGLESIIDISIVKPYPKGDDKGWPGWQFPSSPDEYEGATEDQLFKSKYLHEVYFKDDPDYKGRYSVPVLWDKKLNRMVNNESAELLRWLPTAFDSILDSNAPGRDIDLYPESLRSTIDEINVWMQRDLNSGVYKAGFAPTQEAYDNNVPTVFAALNKLEQLIYKNGGPYVLGKDMTEVDLRAYATIIRFDVVHIKENYTKSHYDINPRAITPLGPFPHIEDGVDLDFGKLKPGSIRHPAVLSRQKELYGSSEEIPSHM